jgi:hypothetical protein
MKNPAESVSRRPRHDRFVAMLFAVLVLPACDTFFGLRGKVTDCDTAAPLPGVGVDVHVVSGPAYDLCLTQAPTP